MADPTGADEAKPKLPPSFEPFAAAKAMAATAELMRSTTQKMMADVKASTLATRSLRTGLGKEALPIRYMQPVMSLRVEEALSAIGARKVRVEQAAIEAAEETRMLVEVATKQERALVSMATLLGDLVQEQSRVARLNRHWRWAFIIAAVVGSVAGVVGVVTGLLG